MSRYYNDYLQHSDEDTLAHFGVPGMKWGRHKAKPLGDPNKDRNIFGGIKQKYVGRLMNKDSKIHNDLKDNDPAFKKLAKKVKKNSAIASKYGFDPEDGTGGNTEKYGDYRIKFERNRYMDNKQKLLVEYDNLNKKYNRETAIKMEKKYPGYTKARTLYVSRIVGSVLSVYGAVGGALMAGKGKRAKGAVLGALTMYGFGHLSTYITTSKMNKEYGIDK